MISGAAKLAGVIGWPVAHSLSPRLHNHWLSELGIDGAYVPLAVAPEALGEAVRALPKLRFRGCNVTIPHKEAVMQYLDEIDPVARSIGAVNTVIVRDGKLVGTNTDAYGFMENLRHSVTNIAPYLERVVIYGAGGAARAVIYGLIEAGAKQMTIINRSAERARALAKHLAPFPIAILAASDVHGIAAAEAQATLLVNTTSLGLKDNQESPSMLEHVDRGALVVDIIYTPLLTPFIARAQAHGNRTVDGLGMLIHQAVPGFEAWFGATPAVTQAVRELLLA